VWNTGYAGRVAIPGRGIIVQSAQIGSVAHSVSGLMNARMGTLPQLETYHSSSSSGVVARSRRMELYRHSL
jgi:hypothetical protein